MAVSTRTAPYANIAHTPVERCSRCTHPLDQSARFCGECGAASTTGAVSRTNAHQENFASSFQRTARELPSYQAPHLDKASVHHATAVQNAVAAPVSAPNFARPNHKIRKPLPDELKSEISTIIVSLARERLFLLMHWTVFLCANTLGLWLAWSAYSGYIGDEGTRMLMAFTPMLFINSIALACLSPIKGTKREIVRLKERLTYVKFQVEYQNLF